MKDVIEYLKSIGWTHEEPYIIATLTDKEADWQVSTANGWWELGKFTDSDVYVPDFGMQAQGRFLGIADGETLEELKKALAEAGVKL